MTGRLSQSTSSVGGLRNTSPRASRAGRDRGAGREPVEEPLDAVCASSRARCIPMQTCGPCANARWRLRVLAPDVEAVGVREHRRVAVGAGDRDSTKSPLRDLARRRARRRASRSGRSPRRPARAAATPRPRSRSSSAHATARAASGCGEQVQSAFTIIPSVVSMPPNIITAAFETTSSRELELAGAAPSDAPARPCSRSASPARRPAPASAARPPRRRSPPRRSRRTSRASSPASGVLEPEQLRDDPRRERPGEAPPQLARAVASKPSISASASASTSGAKRSRTAASRNGSRERVPMARVLARRRA